jgi:hypothetical protein
MYNQRRKVLLGATKDGEIVFGEFEITNRNKYPEFTASFDTVRPFTADDLEDAEDYYESLLDDCYDDAAKYKLCEQYDCSPSELAENMANENGSDPMNIRDCSLYPEIIDVDGTDYYFESGSCGQHDTRNEMYAYTDKDAYDSLHELWDKYHLKNIADAPEVVESFAKIISSLSDIDETEWIADYIRNPPQNKDDEEEVI